MARRRRTTILEWIATAIGLLLTLALFGAIGWQLAEAPPASPPAIVVTWAAPETVGPLHVVPFAARNLSAAPAAQVQIVGRLTEAGAVIEEAHATLDYLPGHSVRRGGLILHHDPAGDTLEIRAVGYAVP